MKFKSLLIIGISILAALFSCKSAKVDELSDSEILHQNQDQLTQVIIYDVFTPPVASRIYAYSSLASYEAMRFEKAGSPSIASKLKKFKKFPEPEKDKKYNFTLAATRAFFTVVHKVVFSIDSLKAHESRVYSQFKNSLDPEVYDRSVAFGDSVGKVVVARAEIDNYRISRSKAKFLGNQRPGQWRPTAPDYMDGVEWCWGTMEPLAIDSAALTSQLPEPPEYSMDTSSVYYKEVQGILTLTQNLTQEQKDIARFWDDNPFVMEHAGHMMFANKKITPGGHWMGIAAIASRKTNADLVKIAQAYAVTAVSLYDAFIACWSLKYKFNTVRPITVINEFIDNDWVPMLQTPPFPEYPSGHSTITRAASAVLTKIFGENFAFQDTSDLRYIGMKRDFKSFKQASDEASISRVYGGIHYIFSVNEGVVQGQKVGDKVIERLKL